MAYPVAEIPTHSAFRVHGFGRTDALHRAIETAKILLARWHVSVEGPSGRESPTPYFWKATLALVTSVGSDVVERLTPDLEDRDPLLIGLAEEHVPAPGLLGTQAPDLWCMSLDTEAALKQSIPAMAESGAVAVFGPSGAAWKSNSGTFGQSEGILGHKTSGDPETLFGVFAGGLACGLLEDLLGDNLFNKTSVRIERECLEMRPLRLGRAVETGLAAAAVVSDYGGKIPEGKNGAGEFANKVRRQLREWRGPESQTWGARGR